MLEHAPFRRDALLAWSSVPPVHDEVYGLLLDHEAEGAAEAGALPAWPLGDRLVDEIFALVPSRSRKPRTRAAAASERLAIPAEKVLALRAVKGVLLARDLDVATAHEARGAGRTRRGLVFRRDCTLDALLERIDEKGLSWSRRTGASPQFDVSGTVDGRELRMRLVERADVGGLAASVAARDLGGVRTFLAEHLQASFDEPTPEEGASRVEWLRSALIADRPPEEALARGLSAPSAEVRRTALEAAWLAMSPGTLDVLRERESVEPDLALRELVATTVALLAPAAPDSAATASAIRKASLLHARQRREGLEELAARELPSEAAGSARELLAEVARGADDRDARFLAGLLAWLRC